MAAVDTEVGRGDPTLLTHHNVAAAFTDSVDAILAAAGDGSDAGHELAGFKRQCGAYGYRFVARCRRCGHEVVVGRGGTGWAYSRSRTCADANALGVLTGR